MGSSNLVRIGYKKEVTLGITPAAVKASLVVQDLTYTAKNGGEAGNLISVEYLDTGTAGAEVVTVTSNKISVSMEDGVSTATQVKAAVDGSAAAMLLVGVTISGTAGDAQVALAEDFLENGAGQFKTARFTSEQYSGTPQTTESQQIRTDRQSSGQVVTGLQVEGGHNFELAKEEAIEDFLESAMFNAWATSSVQNLNLELNLTTKKLIRATGSFINEGVKVGDFVKLTNFAVAGNNTYIMATAVSALEVDFAHPPGMVTAVSEAASYQICDKLSIGVTKKSLTIEKSFLDLTTKALIYRGCLVSQMELNVEYGSLISGSFQTMGTDYDAADIASEFASYETSFKAAATTGSLNGSVDMPFTATDVTGTWAQDAFCLQSLGLSLNNNLTVQNCIGKAAPEDYSPGTAQLQATLSSYLKDTNWGLLAKKLSQAPFALGFMVQNPDGWYGFFIPALQVSFDDPQSGGANQEISIEMQGVAKVGSAGESALTIYREPTV
jgi:hypothetical protein